MVAAFSIFPDRSSLSTCNARSIARHAENFGLAKALGITATLLVVLGLYLLLYSFVIGVHSLVDDEPDITLTLKDGLEENGFAKVDAFNDPLIALVSYKTGSYDLVLLDIKMPKLNRFELRRNREERRKEYERMFYYGT